MLNWDIKFNRVKWNLNSYFTKFSHNMEIYRISICPFGLLLFSYAIGTMNTSIKILGLIETEQRCLWMSHIQWGESTFWCNKVMERSSWSDWGRKEWRRVKCCFFVWNSLVEVSNFLHDGENMKVQVVLRERNQHLLLYKLLAQNEASL